MGHLFNGSLWLLHSSKDHQNVVRSGNLPIMGMKVTLDPKEDMGWVIRGAPAEAGNCLNIWLIIIKSL